MLLLSKSAILDLMKQIEFDHGPENVAYYLPKYLDRMDAAASAVWPPLCPNCGVRGQNTSCEHHTYYPTVKNEK